MNTLIKATFDGQRSIKAYCVWCVAGQGYDGHAAIHYITIVPVSTRPPLYTRILPFWEPRLPEKSTLVTGDLQRTVSVPGLTLQGTTDIQRTVGVPGLTLQGKTDIHRTVAVYGLTLQGTTDIQRTVGVPGLTLQGTTDIHRTVGVPGLTLQGTTDIHRTVSVPGLTLQGTTDIHRTVAVPGLTLQGTTDIHRTVGVPGLTLQGKTDIHSVPQVISPGDPGRDAFERSIQGILGADNLPWDQIHRGFKGPNYSQVRGNFITLNGSY